MFALALRIMMCFFNESRLYTVKAEGLVCLFSSELPAPCHFRLCQLSESRVGLFWISGMFTFEGNVFFELYIQRKNEV